MKARRVSSHGAQGLSLVCVGFCWGLGVQCLFRVLRASSQFVSGLGVGGFQFRLRTLCADF